MMVKILGTAVHLDCKPLKVSCIESLKPNNDSVVPATFRLSYNVIAPIQILKTLGVDISANPKFDPLFNIINHSCIPNASYRYEGGGTAMTLRAARHIKKGEEICISYVEPWMPEKERMDELWKCVGCLCGCSSCKRERLAREMYLRCKEPQLKSFGPSSDPKFCQIRGACNHDAYQSSLPSSQIALPNT